ncbi:MAG: hypothetical protein QOH32_2130 [Bradyrhizobium sp.]|jgi:hypothetical protein|nr:hypothetical protein [Bradyrhizobium sp.]
MLQPRLLNSAGIAVSIATHVAVLTVGLGYAAVRPLETTPVEAIVVDIVPAEEVRQAPQTTLPESKPPVDIADRATSDPAAPSASKAPPAQERASVQPVTSAVPPPPEQTAGKQAVLRTPASTVQPASWRPPEPDLTVKYQVNLGLPARGSDDFDAPAAAAAKVSNDHIARFRERLKSCAVLPESVAPGDKVTIRLRANFLRDGRLASAPLLIEASASAKGPALMQAAIDALEGCQPYAALPADKYSEWKVLDLSFTPQDFRRG